MDKDPQATVKMNTQNTDQINWSEWVSAGKTRNWMKEDPLLDWLELHGEKKGFARDSDHPCFIPEADFSEFVMRKGTEFEAGVMAILEERLAAHGLEMVAVGQGGRGDARSSELRGRTEQLMRAGTAVILQGVLWDQANKLYGMPDLLVRSDILDRLVENPSGCSEPNHGAPGLGLASFHYVVVDVKFRGFKLDRFWEASSDADHYKVQLAVYNSALAALQGFYPTKAFFIGRGWQKGSGGNQEESSSCLDRLIPVSLPGVWHDKALEAAEWIRRVRCEGGGWDALPPSIPELRPNMKNTEDSPWHLAKKKIAEETGELTQIWWLGLKTRNEIISQGGPSDWRSPAFSLPSGKSDTDKRRLKMLEHNRSESGPVIEPAFIPWRREAWGAPQALEFFVDFETTSSLDDDFSKLPEKGGQPLIFMIGCGHWEPMTENDRSDPSWSLDPSRRRWSFKVFTAESLTESEEMRIVQEWFRHMEEVRLAVPGAPERPPVFHWSPAETRTYSAGKDSAFVRHHRPDLWREPSWFDFLAEVVKPKQTSDAVFVRGAWGFGLKAIGKALYRRGLIETLWMDGPADGLAAMSGAWTCYAKAKQEGRPVGEVELLDVSGKPHKLFAEITGYNEVDCRVMAEAICCIRSFDGGGQEDNRQDSWLPH